MRKYRIFQPVLNFLSKIHREYRKRGVTINTYLIAWNQIKQESNNPIKTSFDLEREEEKCNIRNTVREKRAMMISG